MHWSFLLRSDLMEWHRLLGGMYRCSLISLFLSIEHLSHVCFALLPKPQHIWIDIRSMSELNIVAVKIFDIVIHGSFNEPLILFPEVGRHGMLKFA